MLGPSGTNQTNDPALILVAPAKAGAQMLPLA